MFEFYTWPEAAQLLFTFLFALCVLLQTLAAVLSSYRHPRSRTRLFENLFEVAVLVQILLCSLLHGQASLRFETGLLAPTGYVVPRYIVFAAVALLAGIVAVLLKNPWPLLAAAASAATLPLTETLTRGAFIWLYVGAMLFWLLRSSHICLMRYRELKTNISALSIKTAIDSLHSGVLFCAPDGFILLSNVQMLRLMAATTGRARRNGSHFYNLLVSGDLEPGCERAAYEGQIVCLLPDKTAWMFSKTDLFIGKRAYVQLTATDVTLRWELTAQLQRQNEQLQLRSDELNEAIANLHILSRERETQRAKMRAHDILGQRLTVMLRTIRSEQMLDHGVLHTLSQGLMEDLKSGRREHVPHDELESMRQAFSSIGVNVMAQGALPGDALKGQLFVDIIRESVTNAVRHGFATEIFIEMTNTDSSHCLRITDNGHPPQEPITEGGGIGGMRRKVEPHGGALFVTTRPRFVLEVELPGGETDA